MPRAPCRPRGSYYTRYSRSRKTIRDGLTAELRESTACELPLPYIDSCVRIAIGKITGNPVVRMCWTPHTFHCRLHLRYGIELVGWPRKLPFTNLSKLPGGNVSLDKLLLRWRCGKLRFEHCKHSGIAPPGPQRRTRSDIGYRRPQSVQNPLSSRRRKAGKSDPKSVEVIEDSDSETGDRPDTHSSDLSEDSEDELEDESAIETIEDWSEPELVEDAIQDADDWSEL